MTNQEIIKKLKLDQFGFLSTVTLTQLAQLDRLHPVLVRCDRCRFTAPAQDVQHIIDLLEHDKGDWVRDVSLAAE